VHYKTQATKTNSAVNKLHQQESKISNNINTFIITSVSG